MKISAKLSISYGILIVILIGIIGLSLNGLSTLKNEINVIAYEQFPKTIWANNIIEQVHEGARSMRNAFLSNDPEFQKKEIESTLATTPAINTLLDSLERTIQSDEGKKLLLALKESRKVYSEQRVELLELFKSGQKEALLNKLFTDFRNVQGNYIKSINDLTDFQTHLVNKAAVDAEEQYSSIFTLVLTIAVIAIILTILLALFITRAITKPLGKAVQAAESIAKGDMKVDLETNAKDETGVLLNGMKVMAGNINKLVVELNRVAGAAVDGKLDNRGNDNEFQGEYQNIVKGFNATLDAVIGPLNVTAEYVDRISKGDIPPKITDNYNGDFNEIKNNLNQCIDSVDLLVKDALMLSQAAVDGKLDTRANASKHQGEFRAIVEGVNKTLDNVIGPLNVAAEYVDRISKGDIPPKITDNYNGDFNEIKSNLNSAIDVMNGLLAETNMLIQATKNGQLDKRGNSDKFAGNWGTLVSGVNDLITAFVAPINVTAEYVDRIAKGDIPPKITDIYHGDFNEIKNNLNTAIDVMNGLLAETNMLIQATKNGQLDKRGNADKFAGDWGTLVSGVNDLITAFVAPINVTAEYVDRIAKGDIPPKITDIYHGDFNEIKNNLNSAIDVMNGLLAETNVLIQATKNGQLDKRGNPDKFAGDWGTLVLGINDLINAFVAPINVTAEYVDRIAKGDIPPKISDIYHGDFNEIKNNLNTAIDVMNGLLAETNMLIQATKNGQLDKRGNPDKFAGDWGTLIVGVNDLINAFVAPINVTADYVDRISKGDIPPKITDIYYGDFNEIKNNLNQCIDSVNSLVADASMLAKAAVDGKLDTRADASKHQGDFRAIVEGVNKTLDNVIGPLNVAAKYVDRISKGDIPPKITDIYHGDFNEIKNNLNVLIDATKNVAQAIESVSKGNLNVSITERCPEDILIRSVNLLIKNISDLTTDFNILSENAMNGKLDTRADISKHQGDFRTIVEGVNKTLDNVTGPLNVAAEYVDRISKGDIPPMITDVYFGDFNEIKNNLNQCITAVNSLVSDTAGLTQAAIEGRLTTRADATQHQGDFRKIVDGVNKTLDLFIEPINEAGEILSVMATGDLTVRMLGSYNGDLSKLKNDINLLADSLSSLINQVNEVVHASASSAMQISASAEGLAAATQEQSTQADDVASAVEQMARTITDNSSSANKTAEMAQMNGDIATEGGTVVSQTVEKMRDIAKVVKNSAENIEKLGESSKQIGEIISVIDDIADQTNLLALNAAIEAARAGEQGRGFAVVADEVRKLAERTTEATKQIANMIKGIQTETQQAVVAMNKGNEEVRSGIELADKAGISLQQILTSTRDVMDMINQIAASSEEQSATSEEISKNVMSISKVTSESAHRVEDVAHTSDELAKMTEQLATLMGQFRVENGNNGDGDFMKQLGKRAGRQLVSGH